MELDFLYATKCTVVVQIRLICAGKFYAGNYTTIREVTDACNVKSQLRPVQVSTRSRRQVFQLLMTCLSCQLYRA